MHRIADYFLGRARVFGASATVDDERAPRVRFYEVKSGLLAPVTP